MRDRFAAARITGFFFGTTDDTTTMSTSRRRKIRRSAALVSFRVSIRFGFEIRRRVAKASFVNELLMSIKR